MTVHLYEITSGARRILIKEGGPPRWRGDDQSVYVEAYSLDGAQEKRFSDGSIDYRFGTRWGLRFDDEVPHEAAQHKLLLERLAERDIQGNPKIRDVVPYEPQFVMRESDIEDAVTLRIEEALEEQLAKLEAGRYSRTVKCPAAICSSEKIFSPQGIRGHMDVYGNRHKGLSDEEKAAHRAALVAWDAERAQKKAS